MIKKAISGLAIAASASAAQQESNENILQVSELLHSTQFWTAAAQTFIDRNGLEDVQMFENHRKIIYTNFQLANAEFSNPDDMKMFVRSLGRLGIVAKDAYELVMLMTETENFNIIWNRISKTSLSDYFKMFMWAYGDVAVLYYDEQYAEAGKELVTLINPTRYKKHSNVDWTPLPQYNDYEGDVASGMLAGMIYSMTGEKNFDNLAKCIRPAHDFEKVFGPYTNVLKLDQRGATALFFDKQNNSVLMSMSQMHKGFQHLDEYVLDCNDETKRQVASIKEKYGSTNDLDSEWILNKLHAHRKWMELRIKTAKMKNAMHNYQEVGDIMGQAYIKLVEPDGKGLVFKSIFDD